MLPEKPLQKPITFHHHWPKLVAFTFWCLVIGSIIWYISEYQVTPLEVLSDLVKVLRTPMGPLLLMVAFVLSSVLFLPIASLLTVTAGMVFGPIVGMVYALIGYNLAAVAAYFIGRWFGQDVLESLQSREMLHRYSLRLYRNSFETVLLLRLLYLPLEVDAYLAGFLRINLRTFLLASILGSIPGSLSLALAGASISIDPNHDLLVHSFDVRMLILSGFIFFSSLLVSRWLRRREELLDHDSIK